MAFDWFVIGLPTAAVALLCGALYYYFLYTPKKVRMLESVINASKDKKPLWVFMGNKGTGWQSFPIDAKEDAYGANIRFTNGLTLARVTDDDIRFIGGKLSFALGAGGVIGCRIDANQTTRMWDLARVDSLMSEITREQIKAEIEDNLISSIEKANEMKQKDYTFKDDIERKKRRRLELDTM